MTKICDKRDVKLLLTNLFSRYETRLVTRKLNLEKIICKLLF